MSDHEPGVDRHDQVLGQSEMRAYARSVGISLHPSGDVDVLRILRGVFVDDDGVRHVLHAAVLVGPAEFLTGDRLVEWLREVADDTEAILSGQ